MQVIEKDGTMRDPEPYEPEKLEKALQDPKVQEVRVFRLEKGTILNIRGTRYKVTAVRPNGKVTMKEIRRG